MDNKTLKAISLVPKIKTRIENFGYKLSSIGQCKGLIYIFLQDMSEADEIKELLKDDEKDICILYKI